MDTQQERLSHLDRALSNGENICSSEGMLCSFPASLKKPFMINGAGLIVCRQGNFTFSLNMKAFSAQAGETVFIPEDSLFQVLSETVLSIVRLSVPKQSDKQPVLHPKPAAPTTK